MLPAISHIHLRVLLSCLKNEQLDVAALLRQAGLPQQLPDNPEAMVDGNRFLELWHQAIRATGEETLALRTANQINPASLGIVGYLVMASATLGEALHHRTRYSDLVRYLTVARMEVDEDWCTLYVEPPTGSDAQRLRPIVERDFALVLSFARFLTEPAQHSSIWVREMQVCHAAPATVAQYERLFGCPVRFAAECNKAVFPRSVLDLPIRTANACVLPALLDQASRQSRADVASLGDFTASVMALLQERLASPPSLAAAAQHFAMSVSTFQRRLRDEGHSYQQLLDQMRSTVAGDLLLANRHSVGEIAFLLGFADASAFHRAFQRWFGCPPSKFRQNPGHR